MGKVFVRRERDDLSIQTFSEILGKSFYLRNKDTISLKLILAFTSFVENDPLRYRKKDDKFCCSKLYP